MPAARGEEKSAEGLLRLLDAPLPRGESVLSRLDAVLAETGRPVHAELLKLLTHLTFGNDAARKIWAGFQVHRASLQRRLQRDVGCRVALFDYLVNVDRRLVNPKIIEFADFERTARSAITDHVTGLFNRAHFDDCLKKEIQRCRRYSQSASLLMMDLDDFKSINDLQGHAAGDAALKDVGRLMIQRVREIDVAARFGGEEFAVILPETRRTSAFVVAERIRAEVERHFRRKGAPGAESRVTISGGISSFPEDAEGAEELLLRADEALYRSKREGKNRVSIYYREKRRSGRVNVEARGIRVMINGSGEGAETPCRALNISERGILIEAPRPLPLGQSFELRLALTPGGAVSLEGDVVRLEQRRTSKGRTVYDAGMRFRFGRKPLPQGLTRFLREAPPAEASA
ncbi:MAG TPA: diguanylate cyclase [Candidatus Polarisedimenticolia bacterium]|nr:diguanylate cyclase [Candidatus Polarisedimenticolia bacterium]